jgi:hypothetical protein
MKVAVAIALLLVTLAGTEAWSRLQFRRRRRRLVAALESAWGRPRDEQNHAELGHYHHTYVARSARSIDPTTWSDLCFDDVFRFLDRTQTVLGREVLYSRVRTLAGSRPDSTDFENLVVRFGGSGAARLEVQLELARITERSAVTAWDIALVEPPALPRWMYWLPGLPVAVLGIAFGALLNPAALGLVFPVWLVALTARFKMAPRIAPWVAPLISAGRILQAADRVARLELASAPTTLTIRRCLPLLQGFSRVARWLGRDPSRGDLAALIAEYFNWFLCFDGIALLFATGIVNRRRGELRQVAEALGTLDAAISIASVRAGTTWTTPLFTGPGHPLTAIALRHPLVAGCVPNSLTLGPEDGMILTGANMTGKSTFLRAIGTNVILAQSLDMVFCERYEGPWMVVRTCLSPSDSLAEGKSLYQVEAETVIDILAEAGRSAVILCLFDELFRGTNSVDRVAASAAVYSSLLASEGSSRRMVIAATHDLELVKFVDSGFGAYHFGDRVSENRLEFEYRLHPGVAPSRNAIALLRLLGAGPALVEDARRRADRIEAASATP